MKRISTIGSLLKKIYRLYSVELLSELQRKGFTDLRPSFLDLLSFICDHEGTSIKQIGLACGLKKQTMTSHLNELEKRGYIIRKMNHMDKREQNIFLTEYGQKFKFSIIEATSDIEKVYVGRMGEVELDRVEVVLRGLYQDFLQGAEIRVIPGAAIMKEDVATSSAVLS